MSQSTAGTGDEYILPLNPTINSKALNYRRATSQTPQKMSHSADVIIRRGASEHNKGGHI